MKKILITIAFIILSGFLVISFVLPHHVLFQINSDDITSVVYRNGNTGSEIIFSDPEDIEKILSIINDFRFAYKTDSAPMEGWSHGLWFHEKNGNTFSIVLLDLSSVRYSGNTYVTSDLNYFADLIELFEK